MHYIVSFLDLEKTLKLVDEVVNFYSVSKEVDVIIQNGPSGGNLDTFLQAMETIENAVKYFEVKSDSYDINLRKWCAFLFRAKHD